MFIRYSRHQVSGASMFPHELLIDSRPIDETYETRGAHHDIALTEDSSVVTRLADVQWKSLCRYDQVFFGIAALKLHCRRRCVWVHGWVVKQDERENPTTHRRLQRTTPRRTRSTTLERITLHIFFQTCLRIRGSYVRSL